MKRSNYSKRCITGITLEKNFQHSALTDVPWREEKKEGMVIWTEDGLGGKNETRLDDRRKKRGRHAYAARGVSPMHVVIVSLV